MYGVQRPARDSRGVRLESTRVDTPCSVLSRDETRETERVSLWSLVRYVRATSYPVDIF